MAVIQIDTSNLATTFRPDEFKGSIALDHHTHGLLLEDFLDKHIGTFLQGGHSFVGGRVHLGNSVKVTEVDEADMDFIISPNDSEDLFSVRRTVTFSEFLLCFTDITFQFTSRLDFEDDKIDWQAIEVVEQEPDGE